MAKSTGTATIEEIAGFAGVNRRTVYDWKEVPGFPKAGADGRYSIWAVAEWRTKRLQPQSSSQQGGSKALEIYRAEKAMLARQQRLQRAGQLLPVAAIKEGLNRLASILRQSAVTLQQNFGNEAAEIYLSALKRFDVSADELFGEKPDAIDGTE